VLTKIRQLVENIQEVDGVIHELEIPCFGIASESFMKFVELFG